MEPRDDVDFVGVDFTDFLQEALLPQADVRQIEDYADQLYEDLGGFAYCVLKDGYC